MAAFSTLLSRLKNADDHAGWQEFFDTYWKLIYGVARKAGLNDAEAQDAVQETVIVDRHGDGAAADAVIAVTHRVGQRLAQGRRRIQRIIHSLEQAGLHLARHRQVVPREPLGLPSARHGLSTILRLISGFGGFGRNRR